MEIFSDFYKSHGRYIEINGEFYDISVMEGVPANEWILMHLNLRSLVSLKLVNCQIKSFPFELVSSSPLLKVLDLSGNEIENIPHQIPSHIELRKINLSRNQIKWVAKDCFTNLEQCMEIDLSNNNLSGTFDIQVTPGLHSLYLGRNGISDFRVASSHGEDTTDLAILDLQFNSLQRLTSEFFSHIVRLHFLQVSSNQIKTVSPSIRSLTGLKQLYLNDNNLACIPQFPLSRLALLDITGNKELQHLPGEIIFSKRHLQLRCDSHLKKLPQLESFAYAVLQCNVPSLKEICSKRVRTSDSIQALPRAPILVEKSFNDSLLCTFCQDNIYDQMGYLMSCPLVHVPVRSAASLLSIEEEDVTSNCFLLKFYFCSECKLCLAKDTRNGNRHIESVSINFVNLLQRINESQVIESHTHLAHLSDTLSYIFGNAKESSSLDPTFSSSSSSRYLNYIPLL